MAKNDKKRNKMLQNVKNGQKCLAIGSNRQRIVGKHYRNGAMGIMILKVHKGFRNLP